MHSKGAAFGGVEGQRLSPCLYLRTNCNGAADSGEAPASVIGGTSLFGGRGKVIHAILGGLVIASIDNGMGLLGLSAAARYVVTGIVLLAAVSLDALASRGRASSGLS